MVQTADSPAAIKARPSRLAPTARQPIITDAPFTSRFSALADTRLAASTPGAPRPACGTTRIRRWSICLASATCRQRLDCLRRDSDTRARGGGLASGLWAGCRGGSGSNDMAISPCGHTCGLTAEERGLRRAAHAPDLPARTMERSSLYAPDLLAMRRSAAPDTPWYRHRIPRFSAWPPPAPATARRPVPQRQANRVYPSRLDRVYPSRLDPSIRVASAASIRVASTASIRVASTASIRVA